MSRPTWAGAFEDLPREHGFEPLEMEGAIPAELRGTLWMNGAGRWQWPGHRSQMWLDADGAVTAIRLGGGAAEGGSRLVRTRSIRREEEAGRMLYGRYGRRSPRVLREMWLGDRRNTGNTSVWALGDRRFALCPEGVPVEIDPETLETIGEHDFGGLVPAGFSAHASHGWSRGVDYNFAMRAGPRTWIDLFAFAPGEAPRVLTSFQLEAPCFMHDFTVTERWAVFVMQPLLIKPLPLLFGLAPFGRCFRWEPARGSEVILVDLDAPHDLVRFEVPAMTLLHWANAWDEDGRVVGLAPVGRDMPGTWAWLESLAAHEAAPVPDVRMSRLEIDPARRTLKVEPLTDEPGEQPRVDPFDEQRPSRFVYHTAFSPEARAGAGGPTDRIVQLDVERGTSVDVRFGDGVYPGEPVYVPRSREAGDGWLLSFVYDPRADRSGLAVADAQRPDDGPVGTAWLDHRVPPPFHGTWVGVGDRAASTPG